ncbi:MAG TPA: CBO0543 family protein [Bacilli bacterium]|nr:CBO0543 family protein [Bacilli bacterium]
MLIDTKRLQELYPSALLSSFMGIFTDLIMVKYNLWKYDSDFFGSLEVPMLLDLSIYPVVAMLYIQFFPEKKSWAKRIFYTACWVLFSISLEWIFLQRGEMEHHMWWRLWYSFGADWIIYGILYTMYRVLKSGMPQEQREEETPLHGRS